MRFFDEYCSDTLAASANQCALFTDDGETVRTGRIYYRIFAGGKQNYTLLFSDTIDSTYDDGGISRKNRVCGDWRIHALRVGITFTADVNEAAEPEEFVPVTFGGKSETEVLPGSLFYTDAFELDAPSGSYLCVEIAFSGHAMPHFPERIIPSFLKTGGTWVPSCEMPFPSMIASGRVPEKRIAFLGDSITEGIGTEENSYKHYAAVIAEKLGRRYAYWDLGIGYARASDAAADGMWLYKARRNDLVVVCLGVNDLLRGASGAQVIESLDIVVRELKAAGCRVIVQTVPPFDYPEAVIGEWDAVNRHILTGLKDADAVFDTVPVLMGEKRHMARYGDHPNAEGCAAWAEELYSVIQRVIEEK